MFITSAFAETATTAPSVADTVMGGGSIFTSLLPIFLILGVFFFLVIRPQNKRFQEHRNMINNLQKGDKVVTGGGLIATVKKTVNDDEVLLELAEGVQVHAVRSTIMAVRSKAD
ncbi:MAG: preprotein translocase subunit YajC [Alphaproteobacteria bacterium]|nr:preprotein translocase subunit YajC [Alphaproteobacteria bacterium]